VVKVIWQKGRIASPPHTDGSVVFARSFLGLIRVHKTTTQTASLSVQSSLQGSLLW